MSIVEIAERLALPKTTVFYWVRDLPLGRPRRDNPHAGSRGMQTKFRMLREEAYEKGRQSFQTLSSNDPTFRDFICMYIGEGCKRDRNRVSIGNWDPRVVTLATKWLRALSSKAQVLSAVPRGPGSARAVRVLGVDTWLGPPGHPSTAKEQQRSPWGPNVAEQIRRAYGHDIRHVAPCTTPGVDGSRPERVGTLACHRGVAQSGRAFRLGRKGPPVQIRPPR
jgi:hypothetical protein